MRSNARLIFAVCRLATVAEICFAGDVNADSAAQKTLFDFFHETSSPGWQIANDEVMGGVSTGQFQRSTNGTVIFSGAVSLANNGGFASVRSQPARQDLTGLGEFVLRVRGDGHRYKFTVRTDSRWDSPLYQCAFTTKRDEWTEHRLPFAAFIPTFRGRVLPDVPPLDPAQVCSVGFLIADQQAGAFRLEIASIHAAPAAQPNRTRD